METLTSSLKRVMVSKQKKEHFQCSNLIFKVEFFTKEQKGARIFTGFVQSDDKKS